MYIVTVGYVSMGFHNMPDAIKLFELINKGVQVEQVDYEKNEDGTSNYSKPIHTTKAVKCSLEVKEVNVTDVPF